MATKTAAAAPAPDRPALEAAPLHAQGMFDCDQCQVFPRNQTMELTTSIKKKISDIGRSGGQTDIAIWLQSSANKQPHWRPSRQNRPQFHDLSTQVNNSLTQLRPLAFVTFAFFCLLRPSPHLNSNDIDESVNPGNNLFVNGLAIKTEIADLEDLFGKYGKVRLSALNQPRTTQDKATFGGQGSFSTDAI